jgi:hypothetical protein
MTPGARERGRWAREGETGASDGDIGGMGEAAGGREGEEDERWAGEAGGEGEAGKREVA